MLSELIFGIIFYSKKRVALHNITKSNFPFHNLFVKKKNHWNENSLLSIFNSLQGNSIKLGLLEWHSEIYKKIYHVFFLGMLKYWNECKISKFNNKIYLNLTVTLIYVYVHFKKCTWVLCWTHIYNIVPEIFPTVTNFLMYKGNVVQRNTRMCMNNYYL